MVSMLSCVRKPNVLHFILALSALGAVAGGCITEEGSSRRDDDDPAGEGGEGGGTQNVPPGMAMVRVVHASPDAPGVDVYAEGIDDAQVSGLVFGDTSDYLVIPPGTYNFQLRAAPSTADSPVVYATGPIEIAEGDKITTIAAGLLGSEADSEKFRVLAFEEGFGPAGEGNAIVRVVHAGADAPSVGIDLHNDDPTSPEITGLDRFTASDAAGVPLTAGEALQIGIAANGSRVTAFTTPELPDGGQLFVIATGLTSSLAREADGFALLAVGPDGTVGFIRQNPIVYALHASPNAPAVDAFAGDAELIDNLSFGQLSAPLQVPPGDYTLSFFGTTSGNVRPGGASAADAATGMLEPGQRYLTIATGLLGGTPNGFQLASYAEGFDLDKPDTALLRLVHSSPDAPAVDVGILNVENIVNPVLVANVSFPQASDAAGLVAGLGTIPIGVTPAGANSTVVASFHVPTAPGVRAFGIAAGALDPQNGQSFRVLAVDTAPTPWTVATIHPQP
jgi:hypothetical protein